MVLTTALVLIGTVCGAVELSKSNFRSGAAWGVVLIGIALLIRDGLLLRG